VSPDFYWFSGEQCWVELPAEEVVNTANEISGYGTWRRMVMSNESLQCGAKRTLASPLCAVTIL
jgi:hypothetical protein